jgi:DNA processing protein
VSAKPLSEQERHDRLRLARTDRVGPVAFDHLLKKYGSAAKALDALPHLSRSSTVPIPTRDEIAAEIAAGVAVGAELLVRGDPIYPYLLAQLDPPPPVLWTLGDAAILRRPAVAVVGARIASAAGQRFARGLAAGLGEAGYLVVSGMARGVDAAAHEGAMPSGTVAVLGGGVDDIYPSEHRDLHRRIAEEGCVVSESPIGARAQARDFPRRNRIISGLSLGVVVVEAEMRSGSLITARMALEQNREVFAVPGSPLDPRANGTNDLIRQGAVLCEGVEDILRTLGEPGAVRAPDREFEDQGPLPADAEIERVRDRVRDLLSPVPAPIDELVRASGEPAPVVFAALVELSISGEAQLLGGGLACRVV